MSGKHDFSSERQALLRLVDDFEALAVETQRLIEVLKHDAGAEVAMARLEAVRKLAERGAELVRRRLEP